MQRTQSTRRTDVTIDYVNDQNDTNDPPPIINQIKKKTTSFRYILSNARSLNPKIGSLIDCFNDLDLHLAIITESWLKPGRELEHDLQDLESGESLAIIHRSRPSKRNRTAGGGVALVYNKDKIRLNERKRPGRNNLCCR